MSDSDSVRRPRPPGEAEVLDYFAALSNRGRWGDGDELGTLNFITPAGVARAAALVVDGLRVGCARPVDLHLASDVIVPPEYRLLASHEPGGERSPGIAADYLGLASHGVTITHLDALAHCSWGGQLYNGRRATTVGPDGAASLSVASLASGIVTRGVLLDIAGLHGRPWLEAGEAIFPEDLEAAERRQGVQIGEGDALLLRTGWPERRTAMGPPSVRMDRPGLQAAALPWLHQRRIAVVASDAANDVGPSGYNVISQPIHFIGSVALGLTLIDNCDFESLSRHCSDRQRWDVLFVVAPLNWPGATASPVTPVAIF